MVELLEPGTQAETCHMSIQGMNGLKGVVVCYNPNNQRYTLELDEDSTSDCGDMMSLRIRNVRKIIKANDGRSDEGSNISIDNNANPASTRRFSTGDDGDGNINTNSSLPRARERTHLESKTDDDDDDKGHRNTSININQQTNLLEPISPMNAILAALVAYFYFQSHHHQINYNYYNEINKPVVTTFAVLSYLMWEWGTKLNPQHPRSNFQLSNLYTRLQKCDFYELMGISTLILWCFEFPTYSIISGGTALFFVWKFGTRNGRESFEWDNVKERVANLNVWEVLMLARVAREGFGVLNHMAHHRRR